LHYKLYLVRKVSC